MNLLGCLVPYLELLSQIYNGRQQDLTATRADQNVPDGESLEPALRREGRVVEEVPVGAPEERAGPRLVDARGDEVAAMVDLAVAVVLPEERPGCDGDGPGEGFGHAQRRDGRVRVRQVGEDAHDQVAAGRVAAQQDPGRRPARLLQDVAQGPDSLGELGRVHGPRGEGVCQDEDGEVLARRARRGHQAVEELEITLVGGQAEAAAVIPDEDRFRVFASQPVALGAVAQVHRLGGHICGPGILLVHDVGQGRDESFFFFF